MKQITIERSENEDKPYVGFRAEKEIKDRLEILARKNSRSLASEVELLCAKAVKVTLK